MFILFEDMMPGDGTRGKKCNLSTSDTTPDDLMFYSQYQETLGLQGTT